MSAEPGNESRGGPRGEPAAEPRRKRPRVDASAFPSMGPGQLRPGRDVDAVDGLVPQAVITPRERAHVLDTIREARAKRLGVLVSGGGTLLHVGARPAACDIRLSMTALGDIQELNPADMTVTCDAGVSLSRLQRALAREGQRLGIDAPRDDRASIGGLVAAGFNGGLREGFGLPRDLVLGLSAIDGCGREWKAGGRVVKNVAGYDLVRLLCGSRGSLAVITELTLRTHPLPEAAATLVFELADAAALEAARRRVRELALPLVAFDFGAAPAAEGLRWLMFARVEGTERQVSDHGDRLCAAVGSDPADATDEWESPAHVDREGGVTLTVQCAPSAMVAAVDAAVGAARSARATALRAGGHLGGGFARIHLAAGNEAALDALWDATGGAAVRQRVLERADPATKKAREVWGPAPASLPLMKAVKDRFDPDRVLSPGRLVGGL